MWGRHGRGEEACFLGASDTPDRSLFSRLVKWRWVESVGSFFRRDGVSSSGPKFVENSNSG
jgi:hypothetical protein